MTGTPGTTGTTSNGNMSNGGMTKDNMGTMSNNAAMQDGMEMTQRKGRWYMGDRRATSAEISQHKKMMMKKPG